VLHGFRILEEWRKSTTANRKIGGPGTGGG
jgi:hypothetical protein